MSKKHKAISTTFANLGVLLVLQAADCLGLAKQNKQKEEPTKEVAPFPGSDTTLPGKGAGGKPVAKVLPQEKEIKTETETKTEEKEKEDTTTGGGTSSEKSSPASIDVSGWHFNENGSFVHADKDGISRGYTHTDESTYAAILGEARKQVIEKLKTEHNIVDRGAFFATADIQSMPPHAANTKTMILVPGFTNGGAGVWSGSVLLNDGLNGGSILPIIREAALKKYKYFIIPKSFDVNTNTTNMQPAFAFIKQLTPSEIAIVAHSRGIEGVVAALPDTEVKAAPNDSVAQNKAFKNKIKLVYVAGGARDTYGSFNTIYPNILPRVGHFSQLEITTPSSRSGKPYNYTTPSDNVSGVLEALG